MPRPLPDPRRQGLGHRRRQRGVQTRDSTPGDRSLLPQDFFSTPKFSSSNSKGKAVYNYSKSSTEVRRKNFSYCIHNKGTEDLLR